MSKWAVVFGDKRWGVEPSSVRHIPLKTSGLLVWPLCGGLWHNNRWSLSGSKETLALPVCGDCKRIGERIARQLDELA